MCQYKKELEYPLNIQKTNPTLIKVTKRQLDGLNGLEITI